MKKNSALALLSLTFCSTTVIAAPLDGFHINGFLSIASAWHTAENVLPTGQELIYNSYVRRRPSFEEDSDVGIQISKHLLEDTSITVQLLARAAYDWDVEAVWAFLKWEPSDQWQFRVGRMRTNPFMLSDVVNVGYAYPWVRPPEEVYAPFPTTFSNSTGVDVKFHRQILDNDFSFILFYGANSTNLHIPTGLPFPSGINQTIFDTVRLRLRDILAASMKFGDENFSVRAGYQIMRLTTQPDSGGTAIDNINYVLNTMVNGVPLLGIEPIGLDYLNYFNVYNAAASFGGIGYQFDWNNIVSMGEIVKRTVASPIVGNAIGWYLMGGYHVKQFLPHITFARERMADNKVRRFNGAINSGFMLLTGSSLTLNEIAATFPQATPYTEGGVGSQSSVTLGLRWDVYEGIALKAEYKHIHPDNLTPGLFDIRPWGSANLYSLALDAVM